MSRGRTNDRLKYKIAMLKSGTYHPALEPLTYDEIAMFFSRIHRKKFHRNSIRRYYLEFKDKPVPKNVLAFFKQSHDFKILNAIGHLDSVFELLMSNELRKNIDTIVEQYTQSPINFLDTLIEKELALPQQTANHSPADDLVDNTPAEDIAVLADDNPALTPNNEPKAKAITAPFARNRQQIKKPQENVSFDPTKYQ